MKRLVILQLLGCLLFSALIMTLFAMGHFSPLSVIAVYSLMGLSNIANAWKMLMKPIHETSTHDKLTGCRNRRSLDLTIPEYEKHSDYAVIFVDINNLKKVNDIHGHNAGDKVLVKASEQLGYWHKYGDLYRLGGDEFIIVITNMSNSNIESIAKDWYSDLSSLNEEYNDDFVCDLSYGIYYNTFKSSVSFRDVMSSADEMMYKMKKEIKSK